MITVLAGTHTLVYPVQQLVYYNMQVSAPTAKLAKKVAKLAHGIAKKKRASASEQSVYDGKTKASRVVLLHAAALMVLKALSFRIASPAIDELFQLLDLIAYIRLEDYLDLQVDVPFFSLECSHENTLI